MIAAMYAYSSESFSDFDDRVVGLLRRGLHRNIVREALRPNAIRKAVQAQLVIGAASIARLLRRPLRSVLRLGTDLGKTPPFARSAEAKRSERL